MRTQRTHCLNDLAHCLKDNLQLGHRSGAPNKQPIRSGKIVVPRKIATRESKAFTDSEANTILAAALAYDEPGALRDAKRWLPWLCAYSGARAGEIAQLRSQDVVQRDGIWTLTLTPEAGTIKNRKLRTVPLHEQSSRKAIWNL